ncbi:hypothetical protein PFICI_04644 [Pestalotiopsis fici W106-1]|uniref:WSC domain-containing protein n=1 Tax=Pestalotiopsis fici (strain W106-1 / CGMCC3.15140) TaxID=1229662 RepID=W3X9J1_PESFW|nr:uncharacterized protein PFICI_04644 [Pestalotiopsis fici W106-1]ETS82768.1 hypothetical protein PFICI_04644 [Pestalotiopsis fici W106-1]
MALRQCRPLMAALGFLSLVSLVSAVDMTYCASLNTADGSANSSTYQSDGLCTEFCSGYAFAVLQYKDCWCSNYVPASSDQVDTSECDTDCPGYPSDTCGGDGLYGYIGLSSNPSGTKGGDSTTAAATTTQASTDSTTTEPTTTAAGESSSTLISTITQGGSVMTVTVMPTGGASASSSTAEVSTSQKGLSTGAAVGTAVGVLGFVGIILAAGFFFWFRRKRREQEEGSMLQHQNSFRGSSAGIMSTPRTEMASVWNDEAQSVGRRSSRLMPHDPRMDPYAANIYGRFDNKSRESINTLRDDQDYSRRVLRTTNPDLPGDN